MTIAEPAGHEVIELQVADLAACRAACEGIKLVLHLAADPSPSADCCDSLCGNNFKGTCNIFRAARDDGCQRVLFASSAHALEGYTRDRQLTPDDPVRPRNMYGVSKCFGEAGAHTLSREGSGWPARCTSAACRWRSSPGRGGRNSTSGCGGSISTRSSRRR